MKRRRPSPTVVKSVRKCHKCGEPTTKRYCDRCIERRFGAIVHRDPSERVSLQGWHEVGDGCFQRRNPYKGSYSL